MKARRNVREEARRTPVDMMVDDPKMQAKILKQFEKQKVPKRKIAEKTIELFSHLQQSDSAHSIISDLFFSSCGIHHSILKFGAQLSGNEISGSKARCIALIYVFQRVINDYKTPENKDMSRECVRAFEPCINFIKQCQPLSLSMRNIVSFLKILLKSIPQGLNEYNSKIWLLVQSRKYLQCKFLLADKRISEHVIPIIRNNDVILVYSPCNLVLTILLDASNSGLQFRVVVIDSRPELKGFDSVRLLSEHGISCTYQLLSSLTFAVKDCSLVLVSVEGLLSNGSLLARAGTSMVCLVAKTYNVPVMVCCESFKFTDRVQIDSIVYNELGDSDDVSRIPNISSGPLQNWRNISSLWILNLKYDITPPELVDVVVTECGLIPCTSIPVIIRVQTNLD